MLHDLAVDRCRMFENYFTMSSVDYEYFLNEIGPEIKKMDTVMRESIPAQEKLTITLRFLATEDSFKSLSYLLKFSVQTVSRCVNDVCKALFL